MGSFLWRTPSGSSFIVRLILAATIFLVAIESRAQSSSDSVLSPLTTMYLRPGINGGLTSPEVPMGSFERLAALLRLETEFVPMRSSDPRLMYGIPRGYYARSYVPAPLADHAWPLGGYSRLNAGTRLFLDPDSDGRLSPIAGSSASLGRGISPVGRRTGDTDALISAAQDGSVRVADAAGRGRAPIVTRDNDDILAPGVSVPRAAAPGLLRESTSTLAPVFGGAGRSNSADGVGRISPVGGARPELPITPSGDADWERLRAELLGRRSPDPNPNARITPTNSGDSERERLRRTLERWRQPLEFSATAQTSTVMRDQAVEPVVPPRTEAGSDTRLEATAGPNPAGRDCVGCEETAPQNDPARLRLGPTEDWRSAHPAAPEVVVGGRRAMATMYQNCGALDIELQPGFKQATLQQPELFRATENDRPHRYVERSQVVQSNPYFPAESPRTPDGRICHHDVREIPPVFHLSAGKPQITDTGGASGGGELRINLHANHTHRLNSNNGQSFVTMDCMGFVAAAFSTAGLKIRRGQGSGSYVMGSGDLMALANNRDPNSSRTSSCVHGVHFDANKSIRPGDVIVMRNPEPGARYGHALLIEDASEDPFGLNKITGLTDPRQCEEKLDPRHFQFTVMQSGSMNGRMAITRQAAQGFFTENWNTNSREPGTGSYIFRLAISACEAKFGGRRTGDYIQEGYRPNPNAAPSNPILVTVVRHATSRDSEANERTKNACRENRPVRLEGESCIGECPQTTEWRRR